MGRCIYIYIHIRKCSKMFVLFYDGIFFELSDPEFEILYVNI